MKWDSNELVVAGLGAALVTFFLAAGAALAAGTTPPTAFWAAGGAVSGGLIGFFIQPPKGKGANDLAESVAEQGTHLAAVAAARESLRSLPPEQAAAGAQALSEVEAATNRPAALAQRRGATPVTAASDGAAGAAQTHHQALADAQKTLRTAQTQLRTLQGDPTRSTGVPQAQATVSSAEARLQVLSAAAAGADSGQSPAASAAADAANRTGPVDWKTPTALLAVFLLLLVVSIALAGGAVIPPKSFGPQSLQNIIKTLVALASAAGTGLIGLFVPAPKSAGHG